jgi:glycosyltransferase involved in cell wall biosynthesis
VTPHLPEEGRPRLSVVIPAYGEERRIATTVHRVRTALAPFVGDSGLEIVVVDDGSADNTAGAARSAGADHVIRFGANRGKGAAVRAGMLASTGSAAVFTDADLAYAPDQIITVLDGIEKGWDVVVGNRHHDDGGRESFGVRDVGHRVFRLVTRVVLDRQFADTQCGLKGFHRLAADRIFAATRVDGFAFDVEVLWLAGHLGFSVLEVPVELGGAEGSTVRLSVDSARMLRDLVRIRRRAATEAYGPRSHAL